MPRIYNLPTSVTYVQKLRPNFVPIKVKSRPVKTWTMKNEIVSNG
jgi:hypothetical protein